MKKTAITLIALAGISLSAAAADFATPKDAEALVATVVKAVAADSAATFKEINAKDPKWVHGDSYPVVLDMKGETLANGLSEKFIGKNAYEFQDVDGKQFVKEYIEATKAKGKSWTDFKFTDPVTKKVLPKSIYCEKVSLKSGDVVVCSGIYKR